MEMETKIKKFEEILKRKVQRLNSKYEELSAHELIVLEETIQTLQCMQDIGLINSWRV